MKKGVASVEYGKSLGYVYGPEADYSEKIAYRILDGDETAWVELDLNPHLITNVSSLLRSEGAFTLARRADSMRLNEKHVLQKSVIYNNTGGVMKIKGSDLRKIIKEELRRAMLSEATSKTFKASVLVTDTDLIDRTGKAYEGDLTFMDSQPRTFAADSGEKFTIKAQTNFSDSANLEAKVPAKMTFISKNEAEVTY